MNWFDRWIWDRRAFANPPRMPPGSSPRSPVGYVRYLVPLNTNLIWLAFIVAVALLVGWMV